MSNLTIKVPKEESFLCPEGTFEAVISDVRSYTRKINGVWKQQFRIVWSVRCPGSDQTEFKAAKNYDPTLQKGSELRDDLEDLGIQFKGESFDLTSVKGMEGRLTIHHIYNETHETPYVSIRKIEPLGPNSRN